ncbi:MAG: ChaN family lipoprotein [Synechococcaceae cyanobacterium]|nr:ChaN family lipoprotein [Synechococcaceae cyanobacterium]
MICSWSRAALLVLLIACALPQAGAVPVPPPTGCAAALAAERASRQRLQAEAPRLDALLLGEIHTSAADHAWQLETLKALSERRPRLALGLEMVPTVRQPALDRYSAGLSDEATFLQEVGWAEVWGHDPALYLPILRWARTRGVPLLALNVEPRVVRRVRREGLAAVPSAQREGIGEPAPLGPAYRARLEQSWRGHGGTVAADLERFLDSQALRDRAMAERIAAAHRRDPGRLVVALIGRGHLEGDDGVPRQLRDLGLARTAAALRPERPPACAAAPAGARLGAYLESAEGAVWVRRVAPGSAAEAAGLQPGDRIVAVNGETVERAGQVILRVANHAGSAPLRLTIERAGRTRQLVVRLATPPAPVPLPVARPQRASVENGATAAPAALTS